MQPETFVASSVRPTRLAALEPSYSVDCEAVAPAPPERPCAPQTRMEAVPQDFLSVIDPRPHMADMASRLLRVCSSVYSRWFMAMRSCIRREKARQQAFREHNGLPKHSSVPYERQPLTASEADVAALSEDVVRSTFGAAPAEYARVKFNDALRTGDMRAFKIRILIFKVRDSLKGSAVYEDFVAGLDKCISEAESKAGCIPDPSPRRMSRAEQERKRIRDARKKDAQSPNGASPLPLFDAVAATETKAEKKNVASVKTTAPDTGRKTSRNAKEGKDVPRTRPNRQDLGSITRDVKVGSFDISIKKSKKRKVSNKIECSVNNNFGVNATKNTDEIVRKTRVYDTVDEIIDDIHEGRIDPYESTDEILADVAAGKLSEVEALLFTMALDRYDPVVDSLPEDMDGEYGDDEDDGGEETDISDDRRDDGYGSRWSDWTDDYD